VHLTVRVAQHPRAWPRSPEAETWAELGPFLLRVQVLLSHGAAYLDLAAEE
jgi:hypothetical protein